MVIFVDMFLIVEMWYRLDMGCTYITGHWMYKLGYCLEVSCSSSLCSISTAHVHLSSQYFICTDWTWTVQMGNVWTWTVKICDWLEISCSIRYVWTWIVEIRYRLGISCRDGALAVEMGFCLEMGCSSLYLIFTAHGQAVSII